MPNGGDRNSVRLCAAIGFRFRLRFGAWPTGVRVRLIADEEARMIAQNRNGRSFNYRPEKPLDGTFNIRAADWLANAQCQVGTRTRLVEKLPNALRNPDKHE